MVSQHDAYVKMCLDILQLNNQNVMLFVFIPFKITKVLYAILPGEPVSFCFVVFYASLTLSSRVIMSS